MAFLQTSSSQLLQNKIKEKTQPPSPSQPLQRKSHVTAIKPTKYAEPK
jgi:hypothetical protein